MKYLNYLILTLFVLTCSACSTIRVPEDFSTKKYPKKGILLASTSIPNFEETVGFSLLYHIHQVEVSDQTAGYDNTNYVRLEVAQRGEDSDFADADGNVHAWALTPGTYELTRWSLSTGYNKFIHPKPLKPITFEITPGHITYLGNIHMNNSYGKNIFGIALARGGLVSFHNEFDRDFQALMTKRPNIEVLPVVDQVPDTPIWLPVGFSLKPHENQSKVAGDGKENAQNQP